MGDDDDQRTMFTRGITAGALAARKAAFSSTQAAAARFASSDAASVTVPLTLNTLSGKYATAAFVAGAKKGQLKPLEQELAALKSVFVAEPQIVDLISNPVLPAADKMATISDVVKKASLSELASGLFTVLSDNSRMPEAPRVIDDFLAIMAAHRGELTITITTAQPLDKDLQARLESALKSSAAASQKGAKLVIENKLNPNLLGGLVVDFADKTVDLSVQSQVNRLNATLAQPI